MQYYKSHCMTVDDAMRLVKSCDLIVDGHGHGRSYCNVAKCKSCEYCAYGPKFAEREKVRLLG